MKKFNNIMKDNRIIDAITVGIVVSGIPALIGYCVGTRHGMTRGYTYAVGDLVESIRIGNTSPIERRCKFKK